MDIKPSRSVARHVSARTGEIHSGGNHCKRAPCWIAMDCPHASPSSAPVASSVGSDSCMTC
jgi:hypothetical protein